MGRNRRQIVSRKVYEFCARVRSGLPFPPNLVMNAILKSVMARVQRDHKVTICAYSWMSNHVHLIAVAKDAEQFARFYGELQKGLTDAVKRLLGLKFLRMWEGHTMVAEIVDAEKVQQRIAYVFANPARANLVDCIEQYPGLSTYQAFKENFSKNIGSSSTESVPYIRVSTINPLGTRSISHAQERVILPALLKQSKVEHQLTIYPNAWIECFGFGDSDVETFNKEIEKRLKAAESLCRQERNAKGWKTFGIEKLKSEPILSPHEPKIKSRKIFFLASTFASRIAALDAFREFDAECRATYEAWRRGDYTLSWPPGAFRPPMGVLANAIC